MYGNLKNGLLHLNNIIITFISREIASIKLTQMIFSVKIANMCTK